MNLATSWPAERLDDEAFERTRRLALRLAGIGLHARHRELLARRAPREGVTGPHGWTDLLDAATDGDAAAEQRLLGLVTTRHTGFFRHPEHFELATAHARRAVETRGRARLWSAATATGEEAWSLAIALVEAFQRPDPPVEILATDIFEAALEAARRAEYDGRTLRPLGEKRRDRFFESQPPGVGRWRLAPSVRTLVRFRALNLAAAAWPVTGPFDVIFCRNVLMYLEADHRYAVLERLASLLAADGLLLLDPAEHPGPAGHWFSCRAAGVYARRRGLPAARRAPAPRHLP